MTRRDEEARRLTRREAQRHEALLARIDAGEIGWADMVDDAPPARVDTLVRVAP